MIFQMLTAKPKRGACGMIAKKAKGITYAAMSVLRNIPFASVANQHFTMNTLPPNTAVQRDHASWMTVNRACVPRDRLRTSPSLVTTKSAMLTTRTATATKVWRNGTLCPTANHS